MDRKIVIGFDGSDGGRDALRLGKQLCEVFDASPLVASCVVFPKYLMDSPELDIAVEEDTRPLFEEAEGILAPLAIETCSLFDGSPGKALLGLAESVGPLSVVVGSAERGPIGRVMHGNTGRSLLTGAPCPVAIAPKGYAQRDGEHLLRIAVGIDGGHDAKRALDEAVTIAERLHATLTVLSVVGPPSIAWGAAPGYGVGDLSGMLDRYAEKLLARTADSMPEGLPVTTKRLEGDPAAALAEASEDFDLMLVGSRGYGPVRRVLAGSVSYRLSRSARCPLFVVPRAAEPNEFDAGRREAGDEAQAAAAGA